MNFEMRSCFQKESKIWREQTDLSQEDGHFNDWKEADFLSKDPNDWTRRFVPYIYKHDRN